MVHQRQGLPLGLEAGDDLARVHARLDDLQRDLAADRLLLLGHEDHAEAAFADLLQQLVRADDRAGAFGEWLVRAGPIDRFAQKTVRRVVRLREAIRPRRGVRGFAPQARSRKAGRSSGDSLTAALKISVWDMAIPAVG